TSLGAALAGGVAGEGRPHDDPGGRRATEGATRPEGDGAAGAGEGWTGAIGREAAARERERPRALEYRPPDRAGRAETGVAARGVVRETDIRRGQQAGIVPDRPAPGGAVAREASPGDPDRRWAGGAILLLDPDRAAARQVAAIVAGRGVA